MNKIKAEQIKVGDVILPPERELRLWMRRTLTEKGLSENALELVVTEVHEGAPDKNGRWVIVKGRQSKAWTANYADPDRDYFMTFKARSQTLWPVMEAA